MSRIEERYLKEYKRFKWAYLLWVIGFWFGAHRIYVKDYRQALILTLLTFFTCGLGAIVGLLDVRNIKYRVNVRNGELYLKIVKDVKKI